VGRGTRRPGGRSPIYRRAPWPPCRLPTDASSVNNRLPRRHNFPPPKLNGAADATPTQCPSQVNVETRQVVDYSRQLHCFAPPSNGSHGTSLRRSRTGVKETKCRARTIQSLPSSGPPPNTWPKNTGPRSASVQSPRFNSPVARARSDGAAKAPKAPKGDPGHTPHSRGSAEEPKTPIGPRTGGVAVPTPLAYPFRTNGKLVGTLPNGDGFSGSASLISPNILLTAGHCVFTTEAVSPKPTKAGWNGNLVFYPSYPLRSSSDRTTGSGITMPHVGRRGTKAPTSLTTTG
jgi:hypothetical protein